MFVLNLDSFVLWHLLVLLYIAFESCGHTFSVNMIYFCFVFVANKFYLISAFVLSQKIKGVIANGHEKLDRLIRAQTP